MKTIASLALSVVAMLSLANMPMGAAEDYDFSTLKADINALNVDGIKNAINHIVQPQRSVVPSTAPSAPPSILPSTAPIAITAAPSSNSTSTAPTAAEASGFTKCFDQAAFDKTFPGAHALYKFDGLVAAAKKYPKFANSGNEQADKRELAAFLAQTAHECDNFKAPEEYAKDTFPESQYCNAAQVPCAKGHRYHGRGPIQLSWNYNYDAAGKALGIDLLNAPEQVGTDSAVAWQTGLWYWMTPQKAGRVIHDVVTKDDGFAQATDIINGGLECGAAAAHKENEQQRIANYKKMCQQLGVEPCKKMSCNA